MNNAFYHQSHKVTTSYEHDLKLITFSLHLLRDLHNLNRALVATGNGHVVALDLGGIGEPLRSRITSLGQRM
jgi:hypothetical protein